METDTEANYFKLNAEMGDNYFLNYKLHYQVINNCN